MNMNCKILIILLIQFSIVFISSQGVIQGSNNDYKAQKFRDYRVIQYVRGTGAGPRNIMNLDNNGDILLACISGKTKEQLHLEGIEFAESQIQLLKSYRLLRNEEGVLITTFLIIEEKKGNLLFDISLLISKKIADHVINFIDLKKLKEKYDFCDERQTLVIVYHELMWDVMESLEKIGLIQKPVAFSNPEKARPEDIADLVLVVKSYN